MSDKGLPENLPGFDDPIGLLRACHEKMLAHLDLLEGIVSTPDATTAQQVIRYFTSSAPLHHRDEEEDLFPRLNRQSMKIAEMIFSLKKEHEQLDRLWNDLLPVLKQPPADGFDTDFIEQVTAFLIDPRCIEYPGSFPISEDHTFYKMVAQKLLY